MLDDIIEVVLELILDGMVEAAGAKKVPMPVRIALAAVLGLLASALFGLLLWVGISSGSVLLIVLDVVLLAACIAWVCFKVKKYKIKKVNGRQHMSFCTYIASDKPLYESDYLWPLSRGSEDIYTEKVYVAQVVPDLDDLSGVLSYIQNHLKTGGELEVWHIWQGVESKPVIRSQTVSVGELTAEHILELQSRDVFATTTQYEIPVQYRIVITK